MYDSFKLTPERGERKSKNLAISHFFKNLINALPLIMSKNLSIGQGEAPIY
jgi:hypothetical protein